jgi:molecular chaperone DnaJ
VKVRIPAGVSDGQRIRLKEKGAPGRNGGPNGDLYVIVRVEPHPLFDRSGDNLKITVPITFPEAALGAEVKVPTLDGPPVTIKVPPGTRSGRTFRVKGRGVPATKRAGDLLVTVEVAVPAKLSNEERKAVEALASATSESPRSHLGV